MTRATWFPALLVFGGSFLTIVTVNDLLNGRGVYLIFVLKKGDGGGGGGGRRLIDTRLLLEGGVYFLSKVTRSNHNRNKLTALLNSNNFHTTFANYLSMKWFICYLFLGRHYQLWKKISGIYVINAP